MSVRYSRNKGNRTERAIVHLLQAQGIAAEKISGMYKPGADLSVPVRGIDRAVEVKCRAGGFKQIYKSFENRDALVIQSDRLEPLVVVRLVFAAELISAAERGRA